nr:DUF945 family protein [Endozoicomonas sp. G2_2]
MPAVAGVLVVGGLVTPYFVGMHIEDVFKEHAVAWGETAGMSMEVSEYQRGWFSSQARVTARNGAVTMRSVYDIHHGPLPALNWASMEGYLESVTSTNGSMQTLTDFFDGPPLSYTATVPLFGHMKMTFFSPQTRGVVDGAADVRWDGLEGTLESDGDVVDMQFTIPGLTIIDGPVNAAFKGGSIKAEGVAFDPDKPNPGVWDQTAIITLDRVDIADSSQDTRIGFSARINNDVHINDDDVTFGSRTAFNFSDVTMQLPGPPPANLALNEGTIEYRLDGISIDALRGLSKRITQAEQSAMSEQLRSQAIAEAFGNTLKAFVAGTPSMTLAIPEFDARSGGMNASVTMSLDQAEAPVAISKTPPMVSLIQRLHIDLDLAFDISLIRAWSGIAPNADLALAKVQQMVDQGFARIEGDRVVSRISAAADEIVINGTPVPEAQRRALMMQLMTNAAASRPDNG